MHGVIRACWGQIIVKLKTRILLIKRAWGWKVTTLATVLGTWTAVCWKRVKVALNSNNKLEINGGQRLAHLGKFAHVGSN